MDLLMETSRENNLDILTGYRGLRVAENSF